MRLGSGKCGANEGEKMRKIEKYVCKYIMNVMSMNKKFPLQFEASIFHHFSSFFKCNSNTQFYRERRKKYLNVNEALYKKAH